MLIQLSIHAPGHDNTTSKPVGLLKVGGMTHTDSSIPLTNKLWSTSHEFGQPAQLPHNNSNAFIYIYACTGYSIGICRFMSMATEDFISGILIYGREEGRGKHTCTI